VRMVESTYEGGTMRKFARTPLAILVSACFCVGVFGSDGATDPGNLIEEADRRFDRWSEPFDFDAYEARLLGAIELWEEALGVLPTENVQSRSYVLNRLAQAYFELGVGYLTSSREKETAFEQGKDAALTSLRLDPAFGETKEASGFRAALRGASDVAAIFWYGNTFGQWLNYHKMTAILGGVRDVAASFERALELDETLDGAGPYRALGSLYAQAHFVVGAAREDAVSHFERCIELAPDHLEAYVSYAEQYARPAGDEALFDALIATVLEKAADPAVMAAYPFYNTLAVKRARELDEE